MKQTHVLYHAHCMDGLAAAWCVYRFLGLTMADKTRDEAWGGTVFGDESTIFHPVKYGGPLPDIGPEDDLYCVDFCPAPEVVASWLARPGRTTLLDHHASAVRRCLPLLEPMPHRHIGTFGDTFGLAWGEPKAGSKVVFDLDRSGARIAWDELNPDGVFQIGAPRLPKPAPWFIDYVQDRDLWRWLLPESKAVSAFMRSFGLDLTTLFPLFDEWADDRGVTGYAIDCGRALLRQQEQDVRAIAPSLDWWDMPDGLGGTVSVPVVNSCIHGSELGHFLVVEHDAPFSVTWYDEGVGADTVKFSLRGRDGGLDVSKVAEMFGGGGHPAAAGFRQPRRDFVPARGVWA